MRLDRQATLRAEFVGVREPVAGPQNSREALPCWCGAAAWDQRFRTRRFGVLRCRECQTYRIDPPVLRSTEEGRTFYKEYYKKVGTDARPIARPASSRTSDFWRVAEECGWLNRPGRRAVDIGCGEGHSCAELRAAGWPSVTGIDISTTRIARARHLYPEVALVAGTIGDMAFDRASLDLVLVEHVIEHLPDPRSTLQEVRGSLASVGHVVISTPNMDSGHFRFLGKRWTGMLAPHAHIFLFDAKSLTRLLEASGFTVLATGSFEKEPYSLQALLRRLGSGDIKGTLWRIHQEIGAYYGRLIGRGPLLYAVARPRPCKQQKHPPST